MTTLFVIGHVLAVIFLVGPLSVAPLLGLRGIPRRDAARVHAAARQTALFGAGSLLMGALGAAAVAADDRISFATPWVTISITLYVVALVVTYAATVPALRTAARLVAAGTAAPTDTDEEALPPDDDVAVRSKLDSARGRVLLSGVTILVIFAAIAALMVTKPFSG